MNAGAIFASTEIGYLIDNVNKEDSLLIVDDIFDTGTDH